MTVQASVVGISGDSLRIFQLTNIGEMFNQTSMKLSYTPRAMVTIPEFKTICTIESDNNMFNEKIREQIKNTIYEATGDEEYKEMDPSDVGYPHATKGKWASCLRVIDPNTMESTHVYEFENNEAATAMLVTRRFGAEYTKEGEPLLIVGAAKDIDKQCS